MYVDGEMEENRVLPEYIREFIENLSIAML